jgi:hypothetical protein
MSDIKNKHLIENQIPYHIREQNPLFVKFLEYYYEFLENSKINDITQNVLNYNNSDKASIEFLENFFEELKEFPKSIQANKRLLAKHIYDIYKSKGTEDALKLLFRLAFNEDINVSYPQDNILRASDGRWIQDSVITFEVTDGTFDSNVNTIIVETSVQIYRFKIKKIEVDLAPKYRIYFDARYTFVLDPAQEIKLYIDDTYICAGLSTQMVSDVQIITNGQDWLIGQVITIPGTFKDTILQIKEVNYTGTISKIDIIQHGDGHDFAQLYTISTYDQYIPTENYIEYYSLIGNTITGAKNHYLDINDFSTAKSTSQKLDFFDQSTSTTTTTPYIEGDIVSNNNIISYDGYVDTSADISIDDWINSRTRIMLKSSNLVKLPGYYSEEKSLISSTFSRLQDNEFYQIFSYLIETAQTLKSYSPVLNLVHPAGIRYFSRLTKSREFDVNIVSSRSQSQSLLLIADYVDVNDIKPIFDIQKSLDNDIDVLDTTLAFSLTKQIDNTIASISDALPTFNVTKSLNDSVSGGEDLSVDVVKSLSNSITTTDSLVTGVSLDLSDSVTVSENVPQNAFTLNVVDNIDIITNTDPVYIDVDYVDPYYVYYSDLYFSLGKTINISNTVASISDAIDNFDINKTLNDTIVGTEDSTVDLTIEKSDTVVGSESIASSPNKNVFDDIQIVEGETSSSIKYIEDSYVDLYYVADLMLELNS